MEDEIQEENLWEVSNENETLVWENSQEKMPDAKQVRHAQQMEWARKEVERVEKLALEAQVKLASIDANNLLELSRLDPRMADSVAKSFGYDSFEAAKAEITWGQAVTAKPEDDFEVKYAKKRAEERHQEALEDAEAFIGKSKLDEAKQEEAKIYFDKITNGKQLTRAEAIEYADMATLYVQKERIKEWKYQEWLKEMQSIGLSNSKKTSSKDEWPKFVVRNGELVELLPSNKSK